MFSCENPSRFHFTLDRLNLWYEDEWEEKKLMVSIQTSFWKIWMNFFFPIFFLPSIKILEMRKGFGRATMCRAHIVIKMCMIAIDGKNKLDIYFFIYWWINIESFDLIKMQLYCIDERFAFHLIFFIRS